MSFFTIAKQNTDDQWLDTPLLEADGRTAVAVFSSAAEAEDYVRSAGWSDSETVAQLEPLQVLKWLIQAKENKVDCVTLNPPAEGGHSATWLSLDDPYAVHAQLLDQTAAQISGPQL